MRELFLRGDITAWESNMELLDGLVLPEPVLDDFLHTIDLDPGATALVAWCKERDVPFRILSDGFDYNLDRLQEIHGVAFRYAANRLRYEDDRWRIEAAHPNPACGCGTGTCKRAQIEAHRGRHPAAFCVHIGNGRVSDLCGALAADLAFAKDTLALALYERGERFVPYTTLHDVVAWLSGERARQERVSRDS
jgi:2-hydroxy-3-keto-5-methylthiopentenyl-1-phosphate phosphatase